MAQQIKIDSELMYGFSGAVLSARYDQPKKTPPFHIKLWDLCCDPYPWVAIAAPRHHAKAQSLDSKVLTPGGWCRLGDLELGSKLFAGNGNVTEVVGFSPITEMDLYRVTTADGKSTLCNLDHLWNVEIPSNQPGKLQTLTLADILKYWKTERTDGKTEYRVRIPCIKPVKFNKQDLLIDPYTLGLWLGDGSSDGGCIWSNDPEILEYIPYTWHKKNQKFGYHIDGLRTQLATLGLLKHKHIPEQYLRGSIDQRLGLLQGLMDSDGTCNKKHGQVSFSNTNKQLIDSVVALVRSLGGVATISEATARLHGKDCGLYWRVSIKLTQCPFKLKRKAVLWSSAKSLYSYIVSVERENRTLGRCIKVADAEQTYITDNYLLTHNTTCVTHAFVLANVLFRVRRNVLVVSDTEAQAKSFLGDIKMELTENEILRQDFHIAEIVKDNETEIIVRFKDGELFRICARGAGQKLRGLKWRGRRPDLVVCDDMENDELILNEDRRDKLKNWFLGALIPIGSDDCIFRVVGTILSMDSLLENLLNDSSWKSARFAAHNEDFSEILWPEMWPKERLQAQRKMYVNQGKPDVYSREFLNIPISEEGAFFRPSDFRDLVPIPKDQQTPLNYYVTCDLAISTSVRANYSVFTVSAVDQNNHIRVMQVVRARFDSLEIVDTLFSLYSHYKPVMIAIEGGQIARAIVPMINSEMLTRNIFMRIEVLTPIGDKKLRAGPIQARMRQGTVQFNKNTDWFPAFQQELLQFDKGAYDDQVDSLAWLGQLLDRLHAAPTRSEWEEEVYQEMYEDSTDLSDMQGFDAVGGY